MKILILINNDLGLYNLRKELIEKLIEENFEVYISLPNGPKIENLKKLGCKYIETNIDRRGMNPINDLKLISKYRQIIKAINPDVVLTYTIKPNIYGGIICGLRNVPYIVNITGLGSSIEKKNFLSKMIIEIYKVALKKAKCVFCQNREIYKFLKDKNFNKNLRVIPGSGVNTEFFNVREYPRSNMQTFLFSGRIMKEKGMEEYFAAAKAIKKKYNNVSFKILGFFEEDYKEKISNLQDEGIVEYCGETLDVRSVLESVNCVVLPSYHEGTSNVLLESASMGRPIIASDIPGCKEVINNEESGYVFEVKNTEQLIEKIEKFLDLSYEQKKRMGLNGREKIEKEFDRKIIVNEYLEEINKNIVRGGKRNEK